MPAAAAILPPPTSPYLQALERASTGISKRQQYGNYGYDEDSDVCWVCGNATRASQAYCSNTCRDSDNQQQRTSSADILDDGSNLILYTATEQLQLSPMLSPAVHAVPALVPSGSSSRRTTSNKSGTTTPVAPSAPSSSARRAASSNKAHPAPLTSAGQSTAAGIAHSKPADTADTRRRGSPTTAHHRTSNGIGGNKHHHTSYNGEGSSSSPPSSSATSSPATKTATDEDQIEEDIENLLLPPPIDKKHAALNGFDYAYPYGIRAGTAVVVPRSPPLSSLHSAKTQPNRTTTNAGTNANLQAGSTGMRKSSSQQNNRHSKQQNMMLSPIFAPKSMGATTTTTSTIVHPDLLSRPTTSSSSTSNTAHDHTTPPPLNASEVITFRRRHYAADSMNGHQKSSHGSTTASTTTSSSASPAVHASTTANGTSTSASASNSRRHSSHGSITSPKTHPAFSPLVKARSTTSRSIPTLNDTITGNSNATSSTSSPRMKAVDGSSTTASPSLAASSLSDLLLRTTSRPETTSSSSSHSQQQQQQQQQQSISGNKRASKSDTILANSSSIPENEAVNSTAAAAGIKDGSTKKSWLQRNKLTKTFFSFNGTSTSSALRAGTTTGHTHTSTTCGRKNCPVNHASSPSSTLHPLANFFTPLTRRVSEPGGAGSPFASPAIYYADSMNAVDPFEESFSRSASDSITSALKNTSNISPTTMINGTDGVRRRPSLSSSNTAPPAVITSPSPGPGGVKPQDISGFAGFLFALHNQRKVSASSSGALSPLSPNGSAAAAAVAAAVNAKEASNNKRASFGLYSTPESSESGYDAQDEEVSAIRGRGRASRRPHAPPAGNVEKATEVHAPLFKSESNIQPGRSVDNATAHTAKPALLREKLANVVRASNDRSPSGASPDGTSDQASTADVSPARSNGRPTRFMFGRGNAFKNSNLNENTTTSGTDNAEEEAGKVKAVSPSAVQSDRNRPKSSGREASPRLRHNHSTSVGEGSQYIVSLHGHPSKDGSDSKVGDGGDSSSSEELVLTDEKDSASQSPDRVQQQQQQDQQRGRPTARRRSSANGRMPLISPFTTLERESQQALITNANGDDGGRGRSRARGSAALHRSVSPARSSSRARGRDSPRLRTR